MCETPQLQGGKKKKEQVIIVWIIGLLLYQKLNRFLRYIHNDHRLRKMMEVC